MINLTKKLSALLLSALFVSTQCVLATPIDTGLGNGNGGAVINGAQGGLVDVTTGMGSADLNFNGNAHVNWDTLNVNKGESLNFNAVNGKSGLTVLNTVNHGMSNIYGQINANDGIGNLIISNPNGVLFDGAQFTTAGDAMITTQDMSRVTLDDLSKGTYAKLYQNGMLIPVQIKNSNFEVGGDYSVVAAGINAANSTISAKAIKFVTANGQDYLALGVKQPTKDQTVTRLKAMNINGDLYITNDVGAVEFVNGGNINGNVKVLTSGNVVMNKVAEGNNLNINGNADIKGNGAQMFLRNSKVNGNLRMANGGGFLDVKDVDIKENADLITRDVSTNNMGCKPVKKFIHVAGNTNVGGNLNVDAKDNIHIGGYDYDAQKLLEGKLNVGGDLTAHSKDGHIMTTIDTSADKISMVSDKLNILTDGKATMKANEYQFSANGYIGGLKTTGDTSVDKKVVYIMENYTHIPDTVGTPGNLNIAGGKITRLDAKNGASANILSKGDVELTGANVGKINITAPGKYVNIAGKDVHAGTITVGKETDKLKVDYPGRDYVLKYTNIRDAKEVTVGKNDVITYELTNGPSGYNTRDERPKDTTYLVGPDAPGPIPVPDIEDDENIKVLRSFENQSVNMNQVYTPVAYAADLDDDKKDRGVRKNVDGSVTIVRAFPMIN